MQKAPPTPKGFRDIGPEFAKKRREVISNIAYVLEENGFVPLETPTVEFAQTLTGKYGEEEKLIYKFKDRGNRELALRYDLTVPLARFIANNQNLLKPTFSRYQIGQVFRGENPQHGRYREFTQFDFDTVGPCSAEEDAKIISTAIKSIKKIGLSNTVMFVNNRQNFQDIPHEIIRAIDKIHKIGRDKVLEEIANKMPQEEAEKYLLQIENSKETKDLTEIFNILSSQYKLEQGKDFIFDPTLARGLDYYTGVIFELKPTNNPADLTIGSGGRYDNLIGLFSGKDIPAVGFSFGIDRIVDLLTHDS